MTDAAPTRARRFYADPSFQVLLGMVLGLLLGLASPEVAQQMKPLGDIFLRLIRMAIGPIIFLTVATGVAGMGDLRRLGRVGGLTLLYFEVVSTIALLLGLFVGNVVRPGDGVNAVASGKTAADVAGVLKAGEGHGFVDALVGIVPDNIFRAFVDGQLVQIVFFSVLFGIALAAAGERGRPVEDLLQRVASLLFKIIGIVMYYAPIGAFGALAFTVGRYGLGAAGRLGVFVVCCYGTYLVFIFIVLGIIARLAGVSLWRMIVGLRAELLIVLGTSTTESVLLPAMEKLERMGCPRAIVGLVMPTGYSFNLDGAAVYLSLAVMFIAQAYNINLDLGQQLGVLLVLVVTSKGGAGVAGAALVVLGATLATTNVLPAEGLALLFGIDRLVNVGRAATNLIGNALATLVVSRMAGGAGQGGPTIESLR